MVNPVILPGDFADYLLIENATQRFEETLEVSKTVAAAGIQLQANLDHAAIFCNPPHIVADPLKRLGYISGWDNCCYPSPVDGHDYINVPAGLPSGNAARDRGWFDYVAVVHPVDKLAFDQMLNQNYGNPFIHHLTLGVVPPKRVEESNFDYAGQVIPFMINVRQKIKNIIGDDPGTLIMALPEEVVSHQDFAKTFETWIGDLSLDQYQVEVMDG
ncbi:TPA: hypothetical protein EYO77_08970, partial [Candidatus Poribacteria bacterium]|nr:hypothetical protein [Candidatus Poribacteria bacterium]